MTETVPFVIESAENLPLDEMFGSGREQVVLAVRITPVYGQVDLGLLMRIVDAANLRRFALTREQLFRDEWMLCVFDAYGSED